VVRDDGLAFRRADVEAEPLLDEREVEGVRPAVMIRQAEGVRFQDVVDRDRALVLLVRVAAADGGFVERQRDEAAPLVLGLRHRAPASCDPPPL
jgi:hypothetical protein